MKLKWSGFCIELTLVARFLSRAFVALRCPAKCLHKKGLLENHATDAAFCPVRYVYSFTCERAGSENIDSVC